MTDDDTEVMDLGKVEIGAQREGDRQGQPAVGGRFGLQIEHALDAVDLLLDGGGDGLLHHLRAGAGVR